MDIENLEERLRRLGNTLAHLLEGEFDAIGAFWAVADDPLGRIEETVQFLVLDTRTIAIANRDKEASLLMQQEQLAAKIEMLEAQQQRIQEQERDLRARAQTIERQAAAILELSTPILEVWDDVIVLPVIGLVDARRSAAIMETLLGNIARTPKKWVIIDVTGVEDVDASTADYLIKVCRAAQLLGASCLLSGIRPAVATILVGLGVELTEISTMRSLKEALEHSLGQMQRPSSRPRPWSVQ